ncbi:MmcQ/YjbR family DNA-binding protein [Mycobacterium sp. MMS18-G62]
MPDRAARVADVHEIASSMPHVTRIEGPKGNPIYQVGGKSFVFFRTPQPDAADPETGERYADVIMIWVESEADKLSLIQDPASPFFTTDRFDGHLSVLVRAKDLPKIGRVELTELIQDAWLSRASKRRAERWLAERDV